MGFKLLAKVLALVGGFLAAAVALVFDFLAGTFGVAFGFCVIVFRLVFGLSAAEFFSVVVDCDWFLVTLLVEFGVLEQGLTAAARKEELEEAAVVEGVITAGRFVATRART